MKSGGDNLQPSAFYLIIPVFSVELEKLSDGKLSWKSTAKMT